MSILRLFKNCSYISATALMLLLNGNVSYADTPSGDEGSSVVTPPVSGPYSPPASYYDDFSYDWVDEEGVTHTSKLTEPATEYNQIVAMLRYVYMTPQIPGFVKDYAWETNPFKDNWNNVNSSNNYEPYENEVWQVPYEPCLATGNPYGMKATDKIETPIEGATALMVELVDDYVFDKEHPRTCEDQLKKIKRVTLLTRQRYVGKNVSDNPGFLFNYVGTLNRFFVITKGNNRIANNSEEVNGVLQGHSPFYHMFEEFSPTNKGPRYNAYAGMISGKESYNVDHNCTSILGQDHIMVMSPEPTLENPNTMRDYAVNFMFFLPDLRFANDTRVKELEDGKGPYYGWYTYYDLDHQPYFFLSLINASIDDQPVCEIVTGEDGADKRQATVALRWESTYNEVVGYNALEDFYIYRVINDVEQPDPIDPSEFVMNTNKEAYSDYYTDKFNPTDYAIWDKDYEDPDPDSFRTKGCITTGNKKNIALIKESWENIAHDVYYIVKGRRYYTDFELYSSEIVDATIPGYKLPGETDLNIIIDGERKSTHDLKKCENHYVNKIKLVDRKYNTSKPSQSLPEGKYNDVTLTRMHFDAPIVLQAKRNGLGQKVDANDNIFTKEDGSYDASAEPYPITPNSSKKVVRGTQLKLMRSANKGTATHIATLEVKKIEEDKWNQWLYYCDITYPGNPDKNVTNDQEDHYFFKSSVYGKTAENGQITTDTYFGVSNPVLALHDNVNVLYTFVDSFSVKTEEGTHPSEYNYYIDYVPCVYEDETTAIFNTNSNTVNFVVPKNGIDVGYVPYSYDQIMNDKVHAEKLKANPAGVQFDVTSNPNVDTYEIFPIYNNNQLKPDGEESADNTALVRITRLTDGTLQVDRKNSKGKYDNKVAIIDPKKRTKPTVAIPQGLKENQNYGIVVTYNNGNSYGNKIAMFEARPKPELTVKTYKTPDQPEDPTTCSYAAELNWKGIYPKLEEGAEGFDHHGYRVWHNHNGMDDNTFKPIYTDYDDAGEDTPNEMPMRAASENTDATAKSMVQFFNAHKASEQNPVKHNASVRMYSVIPNNRLIIENPAEGYTGYLVSDHTVNTEVTNFDILPTAIENIADDNSNAPVEYFTLQGIKISKPEAGTVVIRRQGSDVRKIMVK